MSAESKKTFKQHSPVCIVKKKFVGGPKWVYETVKEKDKVWPGLAKGREEKG